MNLDSLLIEDRKIKVAVLSAKVDADSVLLNFFSSNKFPVELNTTRSVEEIKSAEFDLVLFEMNSADTELARQVITDAGIPIVMLTPKIETEKILENFRTGIFDLVIKDEENKYLQILPHVIERAAMVRKFRSRERILSHSIEAINEALFICDANDEFVFVNQAFCGLYGYSYLEILGRSVKIIFKDADENSSLMFPRKCEEIHLKKSGKEVPVLIAISELNANDNFIKIGIATDLTELKLLEEKLRTSQKRLQLAQRMARLSSWEWNFDAKTVTWTDDHLTLFDIENEGEINARTFLKRIHEEDRSIFLKCLKLLKRNKTFPPFDIRITTSKNITKNLNLHFASNKNEKGDIVSIFITLQDITERKELENELSLLNRKKDKFFSIISHDLKSPFNAIVGITELLYNDYDGMKRGEVTEFIKLLSESTKRALDLLNNLLLWSRVQLGTIKFYPQKIVASQQIKNVIANFSELAKERDVTVTNNVNDSIIITVDSEMFTSILSNLITNGINFNKPGGFVNIDATTNGRNIIFTVEDSGVGLSTNDIEKLFKIETHVTDIGGGKNKGTGLGLVLCNEFIKIHGGDITVTSKPNAGTKFSISLPLEL